ncbi:hypothetical protein KP005_04680 [Geomonas nitrogeniifigens]|uniref:SecDF P1 head subdomain domain-containing protein n=1 Tax=Geomonas diazotrophica TaxID=2843197 RepID=A0ABX8JJM3_9BACT|nr:hypothetical protein [Geomonas nitrogeniifigens]QWV98588.1 hypothetical protein KP005_04680 [Geomonas nitrogeniifigens]
MKNMILLGCLLSFFGFAASAYAGFSMNAVSDETVVVNPKKYAMFETTLNRFEPKHKIWVQKEAGLTEEDVDSAKSGSAEIVEDPWAVPPKVLDRLPIVEIRFKSTSRKKLESFTAENVNKIVAIMIDDEILAATKVYEPITDGIIQINSNWTAEEVSHIVDRLNKIVKRKNEGQQGGDTRR